VKWIEGESLKHAAKRAPRPFPRVLHFARSLTSLLEYIHSNQIAVRRIVPSTVMLENTGRVIVIDLRYASVCVDVADTWNEAGIPYIAPEIREVGAGDPESDVYTVGALLYYGITGRAPALDPNEVAPPSDIRANTPALLDRMIMRALKENPAERYHSATEMNDAMTSDTGALRDLMPVRPTGDGAYEDTRAWEKHLRRALGDEYELLDELGSGGFGRVYLVRDLELEREVALKVLHPFLTSDPAVVERFRREAQIAARIVHEHIANTYDIGGRSGLIWYTMEFVPGGSLAQAVEQEGPLEVPRVLQLLYESLDALRHAHGHGLVHRDLKPENILFSDPEGSVRIADFGLAFAHEHHSRFGGASTSHSGTPEFAAPEQLLGEKVDHRTDIYSLSLCAYFALTGSLPFGTGSPISVIASHTTGSLPNVSAMRQDVNTGFLRVLATGAARDPNSRFESAEAFAKALREQAGTGKPSLINRWWRAMNEGKMD
jgi:serine/threonine protein kinase